MFRASRACPLGVLQPTAPSKCAPPACPEATGGSKGSPGAPAVSGAAAQRSGAVPRAARGPAVQVSRLPQVGAGGARLCAAELGAQPGCGMRAVRAPHSVTALHLRPAASPALPGESCSAGHLPFRRKIVLLDALHQHPQKAAVAGGDMRPFWHREEVQSARSTTKNPCC